jgi:hypothetical protein
MMKQLVLVGALVGAMAAFGPLADRTASAQTARQSGAQQEGAAAVPTNAMPLGTVRIPRAVKADDQPLKPGTYQVRLSGDPLKPAVGQTPNLEQWVEFVQGGKVKGKAVASIVPASQINEVAKSGPRPPNNGSRVDVLKGNDYVRVWINRAGMNYLVHLPPAKG